MKHRFALREIERKIWLRTFEHGLWDIALGSMFLSFGLSILISFSPLTAIWVAALYPSLRDAGRHLVIPRIGHVEFKARRQRTNARLVGILYASVVVGRWRIRLGALDSRTFRRRLTIDVGGMIAVTGWLVDFPRLYVYGGLMVAGLWTADLVDGLHLGVALAAVGGVILTIGLSLLVRFLRSYPKRNDGEEPPHA